MQRKQIENSRQSRSRRSRSLNVKYVILDIGWKLISREITPEPAPLFQRRSSHSERYSPLHESLLQVSREDPGTTTDLPPPCNKTAKQSRADLVCNVYFAIRKFTSVWSRILTPACIKTRQNHRSSPKWRGTAESAWLRSRGRYDHLYAAISFPAQESISTDIMCKFGTCTRIASSADASVVSAYLPSEKTSGYTA